jgi:Flp pilus assembly protein TadB
MTTIFAFVGGIGFFLIALGILENLGIRPERSGKKLANLLLPDKGPHDRRKISMLGMLNILLYQARAPISVGEFILVSLGLGALLGVLMYLVSQALLLSLVMFGIGAYLYYTYLLGRREHLSRQYEEAQAQVIYTLYFNLKSKGLDFLGMVENVAETGPEIVREDWKKVAAAVASREPDFTVLNELITYRSSPSFTRIVEALLKFRGEKIHELARVLEDLRRDISLDVEIARENATHIFGARRQLMLVAAMPLVLSLVFILMLPTFKEFYQSGLGQLLMLGIWGFSGAVYLFGAKAASKASMVRPYVVAFAEDRSDDSYKPPRAKEPGLGKEIHGEEPSRAPSTSKAGPLGKEDRYAGLDL